MKCWFNEKDLVKSYGDGGTTEIVSCVFKRIDYDPGTGNFFCMNVDNSVITRRGYVNLCNHRYKGI